VCPRGTDHEGGLTRLHAPIRNNHKTGEKMKERKEIRITTNIDPTQDPEFYTRYLQLKDKYFFSAATLLRNLLRDWVEQQTKEK
jgi:hypothetical protein